MRDLTVERHIGPLDPLAADWTRLVDETHPGAGFRAFPWISSWWQFASTSRSPHVLLARDAGTLTGILPLYAESTALGGRRFRFMGDGIAGSDYQGAIARPEDATRVARAFAAHLMRPGAVELHLDDLADDDPLAAALVERGAEATPRYLCPFVRTASGDFDAWLATRP